VELVISTREKRWKDLPLFIVVAVVFFLSLERKVNVWIFVFRVWFSEGGRGRKKKEEDGFLLFAFYLIYFYFWNLIFFVYG